jgi:hypothetical protein
MRYSTGRTCTGDGTATIATPARPVASLSRALWALADVAPLPVRCTAPRRFPTPTSYPAPAESPPNLEDRFAEDFRAQLLVAILPQPKSDRCSCIEADGMYPQTQRTTRGPIGRHLPLRPGLADDVQRRTVPRRGWECWTLEMAEHLISRRLLEVISNRSAGNGRSPGKPPFPDFQDHFHGHEGGPVGWTSRLPHWGGANLKRGAYSSEFIRPSQPCRLASFAAPTIPNRISARQAAAQAADNSSPQRI